jgi:hypothetical protein
MILLLVVVVLLVLLIVMNASGANINQLLAIPKLMSGLQTSVKKSPI